MKDLALKSMCDTYKMVQKIRVAAENRLRAIKQEYDEKDPRRIIALNHIKSIERFEKEVVKEADEVLSSFPIYAEFLSKVNGISVRTSLRLLSLGLDINKELSSWYAYFGVVPIYWACTCEKGHKVLLPKDPFLTGATCIQSVKTNSDSDVVKDEETGKIQMVERVEMRKCGAKIVSAEPKPPTKVRGYYHFWNDYAKETYFIVTDYWVKKPDNSFYGRVFINERRKLMERGVDYVRTVKGKVVPSRRATLSARRKAFKIFLAHMYQASRELNGMQYRMPYSFEFLKHDDFIDWKKVLEIEKSLRKKDKKIR